MMRPRISSDDRCWIDTLKQEIIRIPQKPSQNASPADNANVCE